MMRRNSLNFLCGLLLINIIFYTGCKENGEKVLSDVEKTAALRNVTFSYNDMQTIIGVPEGALDGQTFAELIKLDSSKYANPANYSVTFSLIMNADNTKDNAEDAKFDGMIVDIVMDTISSSPVETVADAFEVVKDTIMEVNAEGSINLETHRLTGLYIFRQVVDGNDLSTTLSPDLLYKISIKEGVIELPDIHKDIPTRASDEMKAFLSDLLNSGIFDSE